jgi:hypothetical protein
MIDCVYDEPEILPAVLISPIKKKQLHGISAPLNPNRLQFVHKSSHVLGSFYDKSLNESTDLIRRKVQERFGTVQLLMVQYTRKY